MYRRQGKVLLTSLAISSSLLHYKKNTVVCENIKVEKVFLFGDKRALIKKTKENGEVPFFTTNNIKVKSIEFGNGVGGCITSDGEIYIWGTYYDRRENEELVFVDPIKLNINEKYKDLQFSDKDIYLLNKQGELKIVKNYKNCLKNKKFEIETFYKGKFGFFKNEKVVKLSVNKFHLAFVTNKGEVFCSGNNYHGQCGIEPPLKNNMYVNFNVDIINSFYGNEENAQINQWKNKPFIVNEEQRSEIERSEGNKKLKNDTTNNTTNDTTNDKENYKDEQKKSFNSSDNVVLHKIKFKDQVRIVDVSCGLNHTLCVDDKHNVYSFGDDSKIQLGLGESRTNKNSLTGTKWKDQIKFGYSMLTTNLANYSFFDRHLKGTPEKILKKINDIEMIGNVYKINAGMDFSVVFSNNKLGKQLFCFGDNMYFQCGRHLGKHQQTLSTVKLPSNEIIDFSCGNRHCLINIQNKIFGWGYNNLYQISPFKNRGIINNPVNIFSHNTYPININVKYVNAKYENSAVVVETLVSKEMLKKKKRKNREYK